VNVQERIDAFLAGSPHAVIGASRDRSKYGNKVLRAYRQRNLPVFAVNPFTDELEGLPAFPDLASVPQTVYGISVITPPTVTASIVEQAGKLGIQHLWLQPGSENETALSRAEELGLNVIANGPCILVALGYRES